MAQIPFQLLKCSFTLVYPHECLFQCFKERQALVRRSRDEPINGYDPSCELLDFFDGLGRSHIDDGLNFL